MRGKIFSLLVLIRTISPGEGMLRLLRPLIRNLFPRRGQDEVVGEAGLRLPKQALQPLMILRSQKMSNGKLSQFQLIKGIFLYDQVNLVPRIRQSQDNSACSRHLSARGYKYIFFIILAQVFHMISHVLVQFLQRNDVVKIDNKHAK